MLSKNVVAGPAFQASIIAGVTDPGVAVAGSLTLPPVAALIAAENVA
jgi:hypothetical protein